MAAYPTLSIDYDKDTAVTPVTTPALSDAPVATPADDRLGRDVFARAIASLILESPNHTTLRLGIYGGWGTGKTSILRLVEYHVRAAGQHAVWLVPWTFQTTTSCWRHLLATIAEELGIRRNFARVVFAADSKVSELRGAIRSDYRGAIADSVLGTTVHQRLSRWAESESGALLKKIRSTLRTRKLLVLVDDLDRLRPDAVPEVLLTLRELLDEPNIFYLVALSPSVVQRALASVNPAWGESSEFLEKIVELPFHIPEPSLAQWRDFTTGMAAALAESVPLTALSSVSPLLPTNPRKTKLYFRYLATLRTLFQRFSPDEVDWRSLLIAQMLALEFPEHTRRLSQAAEVIQDIQYSLGDSATALKEGVPQTAARPEEPLAPSETAARERFLELCESLRARERLTSGVYGLAELLTLHERRPLLTWKEFDSALEQLKGASPTKLEHWLSGTVPRAQRDDMRRRLFEIAVRGRENTLGAAAESELLDDLHLRLAEADDLLQLARLLAVDAGGFSSGTLRSEHWSQILGHLAQWTHFDRPEYLAVRRQQERECLEAMAAVLPEHTIVDVIAQLSTSFERPSGRRSKEFDLALSRIRPMLEQKLVTMLDRYFRVREGLDQFWADRGPKGLRYVLFDPSSELQRNGSVAQLLARLADDAATSKTVQLNLLTYLRMLTYGAEKGGTFGISACRELLSSESLLSPLWRGATAHPLNPRTTGSLRGDRATLTKMSTVKHELPIPPWWQELEDTFFAGTPE